MTANPLCGLSHSNNGKALPCGIFVKAYPERAKEIIMEWAKEYENVTVQITTDEEV